MFKEIIINTHSYCAMMINGRKRSTVRVMIVDDGTAFAKAEKFLGSLELIANKARTVDDRKISGEYTKGLFIEELEKAKMHLKRRSSTPFNTKFFQISNRMFDSHDIKL